MCEAELLKKIEQQRMRADSYESQLCWLAHWCNEKLGIENNDVIGKEDWPNRLVEVVAKVVSERIKELEAKNKELMEYQLIYDDDTALKKVIKLRERIKEIEAENIAILRRAEAAEEDWQAAEEQIKEFEKVIEIDDEMFIDIRNQYPTTKDLQAKVELRRRKVKKILKGGK